MKLFLNYSHLKTITDAGMKYSIYIVYSCTIPKISKLLKLFFLPYFSRWIIVPLHVKK